MPKSKSSVDKIQSTPTRVDASSSTRCKKDAEVDAMKKPPPPPDIVKFIEDQKKHFAKLGLEASERRRKHAEKDEAGAKRKRPLGEDDNEDVKQQTQEEQASPKRKRSSEEDEDESAKQEPGYKEGPREPGPEGEEAEDEDEEDEEEEQEEQEEEESSEEESDGTIKTVPFDRDLESDSEDSHPHPVRRKLKVAKQRKGLRASLLTRFDVEKEIMRDVLCPVWDAREIATDIATRLQESIEEEEFSSDMEMEARCAVETLETWHGMLNDTVMEWCSLLESRRATFRRRKRRADQRVRDLFDSAGLGHLGKIDRDMVVNRVKKTYDTADLMRLKDEEIMEILDYISVKILDPIGAYRPLNVSSIKKAKVSGWLGSLPEEWDDAEDASGGEPESPTPRRNVDVASTLRALNARCRRK